MAEKDGHEDRRCSVSRLVVSEFVTLDGVMETREEAKISTAEGGPFNSTEVRKVTGSSSTKPWRAMRCCWDE